MSKPEEAPKPKPVKKPTPVQTLDDDTDTGAPPSKPIGHKP